MRDLKNLTKEYLGAIVGGLIGLIFALTGLYRVIIGMVLVFMGIFLGNYIQNNREYVKEKLRNFIDKM